MNKRNKFNARKTKVDGITFDSAKEARRYGELKILQRVGAISDLELQPQYELKVNGYLVCKYRADFMYKDNGKLIVEDVKGMKTDLYNIKKKLMKAIYNIDIKET